MKTDMALERMKRGYTLTTYAKLLGLSKSYLSGIEHRDFKIPKDKTEQFKKLYGG